MTPDEAKAVYIASLKEIIANDPITGPFYAQRSVLQGQTPKDIAQISALTNRINNAASDNVQAALNELRRMRAA